jgi:hypothetical protein
MAIKGVSTRDSINQGFKSIGKLRKGGPKRDGKFGEDLDHFRFTSESDAVAMAFFDAYGPKPNHLTVYLQHNEYERNFSSWRELYGQNQLCKLRCDGQNWVDWIEGDRHHHGSKPCEKQFLDTANRCPGCPLKQVGRLEVILPKLWEAGHIGIVTMETHSWNDIAHISGQLIQYEPLIGKAFTLWRENDRIGAPIKGKRAAVIKSLVHLDLTEEFLLLEFHSAQRRALEKAADRPAIDATIEPDDVWDDNGNDPFYDVVEDPVPPPFAEAQAEDIEPELAHEWTRQEANALFNWTRNDLVIPDRDTLKALGVDQISACPLSPKEARDKINAWIAEQAG